MKRKRGNGEGSVYKTKSGQWKAAITVRNLDGSLRRVTRNAVSQRQARMILDDLRTEYRNPHDAPEKLTVSELLTKWLEGFEGEKSTADLYQNLADNHIGPICGERIVSSLSALDIQQLITSLREKQTGARTVQLCHALLNRVCRWGVTIRLLDHNPCEGTRRPSAKRETIQPFTKEEVRQIIEATKDTKLGPLFRLAIESGMRQGELFGLQWQDVDLEGRTITVSRQAKDYRGTVVLKAPKTEAGIRRLSITTATAEALRAKKATVSPSGTDQVFTSPRGTLIRRTTFGKRIWRPLLAKLGIDHRGAHHLRHTAATMMLGAGVPPHIVAGVLGHQTAETVMKIYAHYITKDSTVAANAMESLLSGSYQNEKRP